MFRQCLVGVSKMQASKKSDGSWAMDGIGGEKFLDTLLLFQRFARPFNSTFYVTTNTDECLSRLETNQSDLSNALVPINTVSPHYQAAEPIFAGKVQFITGYNAMHRDVAKESATVFTNKDLLEPEVYAGALFLLFTFITFISLRVVILLSGREHSRSLVRIICRKVGKMFYQKDTNFRWITTLHSILLFIMITSLMCVYKTSQVVVDTPFYPKSYQESLEHEPSLAFYYDQLSVVSSGFKNAPVDSVKGQLWSKLLESGRQIDLGYYRASETLKFLEASEQFWRELTQSRSIYVASSVVIPFLKSAACSISPEDELWSLPVLSDPSESESIYGYAASKASPKRYLRSLRAAFESDILSHHCSLSFDVSHIIHPLTGTTEEHHKEQKILCDNDDAMEPHVEVKQIPLSYFKSFLYACLTVWMIALAINFLQIAARRRSSKRCMK